MDKFFPWLGLILSFICVQLTVGRSSMSEAKFLAPPPEHIERFHFGFSESIADSLWLRWIQDSDFCQTYLQPMELYNPRPVLPSDREYNPRYKNCDNSWSFKMLEAVTKLAPRFYMPYVAGGISLSVLTEDYAGASVIFNRGVEAFPEDWVLAYRAAYHFLFDVKNKERAAELLLVAGKHGAPEWVNLLASRLYTEEGKAELGLAVLESYKKQLTDPKHIKIIENRIEDIKKQQK